MSGSPACCGVILARREVRNSRTSARLSTSSTLGRRPRRAAMGCPVSTPLDRDSQPPRDAGSLDARGRRSADRRRAPIERRCEELQRCVELSCTPPGDVRVEDRDGPDDPGADRRDHPAVRDLHLRVATCGPTAAPSRSTDHGRWATSTSASSRRSAPRSRTVKAGPVRRRVVLRLRQHLRDLPGRLPVLLRPPRVRCGTDRRPGRAAAHPAGRRHPGRHPGGARRRPDPALAGRLRRARHRLVRRRRRRGRARQDRRRRRRRRGRAARRPGRPAARRRADHRDEPSRRPAAAGAEFGATDIVDERGDDGRRSGSRSSPTGSARTR